MRVRYKYTVNGVEFIGKSEWLNNGVFYPGKIYEVKYHWEKPEKSAVNVYNYAKDNLDKIYNEDENTKINEKNLSNGVKYSVSASDYYCEVIQKENTVLYVTAYPDYQKDAVEIIEELGF